MVMAPVFAGHLTHGTPCLFRVAQASCAAEAHSPGMGVFAPGMPFNDGTAHRAGSSQRVRPEPDGYA